MFILASISLPLTIVLAILAGISFACFFVWMVVVWHGVQTIRHLPTAADGMQLEFNKNEQICVIVPAHNESMCVGHLIESFKAQDHPNARFVLALDRCTDDTAAVARASIAGDERFEVIEIESCPDDWAGKVNAAWTAVKHAPSAQEADLLVFTDADCAFHPGCLRACSALLDARELDLLSLLSTLDTKGWFDWFCQTSATLELVRQYPLRRANRVGQSRRPFANGQFMMFRAQSYWAVGGHKAVHDALLEDIAFARLLSKPHYDFQTGLLLSAGMVRCHMYDSWSQFRTGWKRIYTESLNRRSARMRAAAWKTRFYASILPAGSLVGLLMGLMTDAGTDPLRIGVIIAGSLGLITWIVGSLLVIYTARASVWSLPLQVVGAWLVGGILAEGARDLVAGRATRWGGREYVLVDRSRT